MNDSLETSEVNDLEQCKQKLRDYARLALFLNVKGKEIHQEIYILKEPLIKSFWEAPIIKALTPKQAVLIILQGNV